jgi:nucleotide-binding universal stress UspA family protein
VPFRYRIQDFALGQSGIFSRLLICGRNNGENQMSYKDLMLPLVTYPEAPQDAAIETATAFAAAIAAKVTAVSFSVDIVAPGNLLTDIFLNLPAMVAAEEKKSADLTVQLLARFRESAEPRAVFEACKKERCLVPELREVIVAHARLHDLTMLPVGKVDLTDQWCAEAVIFESGRPVLVIPNQPVRPGKFQLGSVVVAFDFSRAASRALADALPVLKHAKQVTLLTVENEKAIGRRHGPAELKAHLTRHDIDAEIASVDAGGKRIGEVLTSYAATRQADLLVMGAYGHSRMREFVLGGATKSLLSQPPLPILLSH